MELPKIGVKVADEFTGFVGLMCLQFQWQPEQKCLSVMSVYLVVSTAYGMSIAPSDLLPSARERSTVSFTAEI